MGITITEALSEINLLKKKIEDQDTTAWSMLVRAAHVPDLYEKHGGSESMIQKSWQSATDLRKRLVYLRSQISLANITNKITLNGDEMSIFDWLTWKREIYPNLLKSFEQQIKILKDSIAKESQRPEVWKDEQGNTKLVSYIRNADVKVLEDSHRKVVDTYGKLDGQLSLRNATIIVD